MDLFSKGLFLAPWETLPNHGLHFLRVLHTFEVSVFEVVSHKSWAVSPGRIFTSRPSLLCAHAVLESIWCPKVTVFQQKLALHSWGQGVGIGMPHSQKLLQAGAPGGDPEMTSALIYAQAAYLRAVTFNFVRRLRT